MKALLVLEDGTTLHGEGFGAEGETFGEMVFNTGMTGYQETLTDPSYCRQIVTMTAPHIGNTGVNDEDPESRRAWVSGYVIREPSPLVSNWRATGDLDAYLRAEGVTGIAVRGTRLLTRRVRESGAMRAAISTVECDPARLLERVLDSPQMAGADLAREVTTPEPYTVPAQGQTRFRVAAVDLGIKTSTPRNMAARGCEVRVLPATVTAAEILASGPDGVFFSNGPGDPVAATYALDAMRGVLESGVPVFGICYGSQIMALALGLRTYKLRYGHRGVNQPVKDVATGRVYITSHNHGFAADLPGDPGQPFDTPYGPAAVTHVNLNDGVVEGLRLLDRPVFSVQYHPEAAPGPHDAQDHFDQFCTLMAAAPSGSSAPSGSIARLSALERVNHANDQDDLSEKGDTGATAG
jgi:carbamoyl-phosphate synthase small subunit